MFNKYHYENNRRCIYKGPEISVVDPGPYCEDFDINDLVFEDLNDTEDPWIIFLTEMPTSADQTEPEFLIVLNLRVSESNHFDTSFLCDILFKHWINDRVDFSLNTFKHD